MLHRILLLAFLFSLTFSLNAQQFSTITFNHIPYLPEREVTVDSLQRLNLVVPEDATNFPLLIWIGGGAWSYVDRNQEMNLARRFAQEGIAMASIGHRLSPAIWRDSSMNTGITHPKHIEDLASAVKWLFDHASDYGYDIDQFYIGGFSSGAHLATLINLDHRYLKHHDLPTDLFKGIIPVSGAYDIIDYYNVLKNSDQPELADLHVKAVFGTTEKDFIDASPITYLDQLSTPLLLMCDDNLYNYTKLFEDKIRETTFRKVQVVYAYDFSHAGLWRDLSNNEHSTYRMLMIEFIKQKH